MDIVVVLLFMGLLSSWMAVSFIEGQGLGLLGEFIIKGVSTFIDRFLAFNIYGITG